MGDNKEKKFISERILGREMTWQRALKWILVSLICGLVFGAAAFGIYLLGKTAVEATEKKKEEVTVEAETTEPQTEPEKEQVTQPVTEKQTPPETRETEETEEKTEETAAEGETEETGEVSLLDELKAEQETYEFSQADLSRIFEAQTRACEDIAKYITRVSSTISEVTWFESTVETKREYSGIILSVGEDEILILTVTDAIKENGALSVSFFDNTTKEAVLKQQSKKDGWAVVAVSTEGLGVSFIEGLQAVEILPTEEAVAGMPVISAGSPLGVVNSFDFDAIGYVGEIESVEDGSRRLCYSDAKSEVAEGTFLMSLDGRLIGLGIRNEGAGGPAGNSFLMAESCQTMLDSLKKGYDMAWLGITGTDISFEMKYKNIPEGMYVIAVNENGPAFDAGLKRGDIIVNIGSREIKGLSDYCSFMRNLRPGETVVVTIRREAGRSEYKELELTMAAGVR